MTSDAMSASMIIRNSWEDMYDIKFKVVMLGDDGAGKTSLHKMLVQKKFNEEESTTIGVDFTKKTLSVDGTRVQLLIFDTAGQMRFLAVTRSYYRGADGFMILYDSRFNMTQSLSRWLEDVRKHGNVGAPIIVVGTKTDLEGDVCEATEDMEALMRKYPEILALMQTSAKENLNVTEAFATLAKAMVERKEKEVIDAFTPEIPQAEETETTSSTFRSMVNRFKSSFKGESSPVKPEEPSSIKEPAAKVSLRSSETKLERDVRVIGRELKNMEVNMQMVREELAKVNSLNSTVKTLAGELKSMREEIIKIRKDVDEIKLESAMIEDVVQAVNIKCNEENEKLREEVKAIKNNRNED